MCQIQDLEQDRKEDIALGWPSGPGRRSMLRPVGNGRLSGDKICEVLVPDDYGAHRATCRMYMGLSGYGLYGL